MSILFNSLSFKNKKQIDHAGLNWIRNNQVQPSDVDVPSILKLSKVADPKLPRIRIDQQE
jgi:hypothetical protein